jgi:hypothetical protein
MSAQKLQVTRSQFNHHLQIKRDGSRLSASRLWTNRFARHNAFANQWEVGGIVFFYRARLTPCPYYLRSSVRELKPFSSTAKCRGGVRSNYLARGRS